MEKRNQKNKEKGNGEGTIYFSEKLQRYVAQYVEPDTKKRKTLTQKKNEKTSDFKNRFKNTMAKISNGTYIRENNISLCNIINEYIEDKHKIGITGDNAYKRNLYSFILLKKCCKNFINLPIQKVTVQHIKASLPNLIENESKLYSQSIIDKVYMLLNKGFKIAISERLIMYNPMDNESIKKPKSKKETEKVYALTIEEEKALVSALNGKEKNHKYRKIILLSLFTGMRIGETLALTIDDINWKNFETIAIKRTLTRDEHDKVIIGKTAKTQNGIRIIYPNQQAKVILNEIWQEISQSNLKNIYNLIFYDYKNNAIITPSEINCFLKRLNNKYHICKNLHTHMLRHTFATRAVEAGISPKVLQQNLGHSDIKITLNIYTDVSEEFNKNENEKYDTYIKNLGY